MPVHSIMPQTLNVDGVPGLPSVFSHGLKLPATAQLVYCSGQIHSENGPGGMVVIQGPTADKTVRHERGVCAQGRWLIRVMYLLQGMIIGNLEKVLKAGGSSLNQVSLDARFGLPHNPTSVLTPAPNFLALRLVKVNIYITSFDFFGEMNERYNELIPSPKPPRTCVCVKDLPFGAQIEIECIGWTED
ncbi:BQ5605_C015g07960 [Microbotryum silenes-dioicae]|uniref:BQ5605_C015g07960 protein n=1 Tax=Microbotryum silenes-dioicae TaxID=796604 RepID=A0A2X0LT99_9BASI|nr:BQ5605_C015g07960 [Microbotryum silenes-dioicae]